jgi:hypothetical protein
MRMRKIKVLLTSMPLAVLLVSGVDLLWIEKPALAAFPGGNGLLTIDGGA